MAGKRRSPRFISGAIGAVLVVLSLVLSLFALNSSKGIPGIPRTVITMKFTDVGDIHVDSDMREADFRVGRINAVEYEGDGLGTIEAQFDDTRPVYNNATAQIQSRRASARSTSTSTAVRPRQGRCPRRAGSSRSRARSRPPRSSS